MLHNVHGNKPRGLRKLIVIKSLINKADDNIRAAIVHLSNYIEIELFYYDQVSNEMS